MLAIATICIGSRTKELQGRRRVLPVPNTVFVSGH